MNDDKKYSEAILILIKLIPSMSSEQSSITKETPLQAQDLQQFVDLCLQDAEESLSKINIIYNELEVLENGKSSFKVCIKPSSKSGKNGNRLKDIFISLAYHLNHIILDFEVIHSILKNKEANYVEHLGTILHEWQQSLTRAWFTVGITGPVGVAYT